MSFCEHCQGQRFDRSRVLRVLRKLHKELRAGSRRGGGDAAAIAAALEAIRELDIPHLEPLEDFDDDIVH